MTTHYITYQYIPTRTQTHTAQSTTPHQAHFSFQHRHSPTSFQVIRGLHRNTWTLVSCMMRTSQTNKEWAMAPALWPSGKTGPCVQREPTGRAIIVIVIASVVEREEKDREMSRERKRETRDTRRETKMRRERCASVITVFYRTYCFSNK